MICEFDIGVLEIKISKQTLYTYTEDEEIFYTDTLPYKMLCEDFKRIFIRIYRREWLVTQIDQVIEEMIMERDFCLVI